MDNTIVQIPLNKVPVTIKTPFYKTTSFIIICIIIAIITICLIIYFGWVRSVSIEDQKKLVLLKYPDWEILNYDIINSGIFTSAKTIFCIMKNDISQADEITKKGIVSYNSRVITFKYQLFKPIIVDDIIINDIGSAEYKTKRTFTVIKYRGGVGDDSESLSIKLKNFKTNDTISVLQESKLNKKQNTIKFEVPNDYYPILQTFEKGASEAFIKIDSIDILLFNEGGLVLKSALPLLFKIKSESDLSHSFTLPVDDGRKISVSEGNLFWPGFYSVQ